jgi:hypothetical protein
VEQTYEPMYKNRIRGMRCWASGREIAKPMSIKSTGCKSGGCVRKAVELTSGDLLSVRGALWARTEGGAIHPDRAAEVSSGRSSPTTDEGPNGPPQGG